MSLDPELPARRDGRDHTTMPDLELRLIDPERNRFRLYGMTECRSLFGELCLVLTWGRIGHRLRTRTETFVDSSVLERRRRVLIARRHRNGYRLHGPRIEEGIRTAPKARRA